MAPLPSEIISKVVERELAFDQGEEDFGCHMLMCGFDDRPPEEDRDRKPAVGGRSAILFVDEKGDVTPQFDLGFCAIGEGSDSATARMQLLGYRPWMDIGRVLFLALDAKLTAERIASVGPETDAWVLLPHADRPIHINKVAPTLIEELSAVRNRNLRQSAFPPPAALKEPREPSPDWSQQLLAFVRSCYEDRLSAKAIFDAYGSPEWLENRGNS